MKKIPIEFGNAELLYNYWLWYSNPRPREDPKESPVERKEGTVFHESVEDGRLKWKGRRKEVGLSR